MRKRGKLILSVMGVGVSVALLAVSAYLTENKVINPTLAMVFTLISTVLLLIAILFAVKVDYETGVYECPQCGHTFKPCFKAYLLGPHTLKRRYLKCPKCGGKSWCKREHIFEEGEFYG